MKKMFTVRWRQSMVPLILSLLLGIHLPLHAQIPASSYIFSAQAGTFTEITGGTAVTAIQDDDVQSAVINIGFNFTYCGNVYTSFRTNSNGWITFGGGTTDPVAMRENSTANMATLKPLLMPLWDDLNGNAGNASYLVSGASPNRVFTFQWKNWKWYWNGAVNISYQVKLYETTNVIEYVYRQEASAGTPGGTGGCTIGIGDGAATPTYLSLNNAGATPTASATIFTTDIQTRPATGQIYRFTPPPPCTTITTWPVAVTPTASPNPVCISSGVVSLDLPAGTLPIVSGLTYQWDTSANGTSNWGASSASLTAPPYTATGVTSTRYFRCRVFCNGGATPVWTSNSIQVNVTNPGSSTAINGSRCGPGVVALAVTPPAGSPTIRWYQNATGGAILGTGNTYTTNYLTQNTTYYAVAASAPTTITAGRAAPQGSSTGFTFSADYGMVFTATQPFTIQSVDVYHTSTTAGSTFVLLKNSAGVTLQTAGPFVLPIGTGTTLTGGATPTTLALNFNVSPGAGYRLVDSARTGSIIRDNPISGWSYPLPIGLVGNITSALAAGGTSTGTHYYFYNWRVAASCEGSRVPVTATVNASTPVVKSLPAVVCNNSVAAIALTPPTPPYPSYNWSPVTNLYTNAAGTTPYTGGSAATIYMKTTNVGTQTYYMMAGNPNVPTGCTFADTIKIWVQPGSLTIKGQPDTICTSGASTLTLDPATGYATSTIQWQDSIPGTSTAFNNIGSATNPTYTTPSLSFGQNRYYRALVRADSNVCEMPVKYVVIANPTLIGAPDSFNCGPGHVTLTALTGGNSTPVWYDSPTGNTRVGSGTPFITPYLGTTTSFWVAANAGGSAGSGTVGNGVSTSTSYVSPFYHLFGGQKNQYLIRASELLAAGIPAGARITSIGLDVVTAGFTYQKFAVSAGMTSATVLGTTWQPVTQVRAPANVTTTAGINTLTFDNPYPWNGTSNLVIQTCYSDSTGGGTSNSIKYDATSYVATAYQRTDNVSANAMCSNTTVSSTLSQRPKFIISYDNRCETSREEVIAYIRPVPSVNLGTDINDCVDEGTIRVLDAGVQPNIPAFLWDNGSTSQVRAVSESGSYHVTVTNQYTCAKSDTINVNLRRNPVVDLGSDTSVCNGVTLSLNAGSDGVSYFWSNGATSQVVNVSEEGSYHVFVTNNLGCIKSDTIVVSMSGELPAIDGININNNGLNTFKFTAMNPQNVIGYDWDFGDSSEHSFQQSPTHVYANGAASYVVVLRLSSSCGFLSDTTSAHITGIHQLNVGNDEMTVYPNPAKATATILNKGNLKMEKVEVYNVLGQVVYRAAADSKDKHTLALGGMSAGVYTIQVYTDKGTVARKLEIMK
ncbi:Ig-like domain-containing protein [Taibaiella koreensis]|uniref:Ig-like domain-containing protein n=1 Tax=Taibaiella koreensis TaxID=1268548 RepID=UPI000E599920|nr:T9SS type A sorting domain-containing protein [Taibaiella koreensis]